MGDQINREARKGAVQRVAKRTTGTLKRAQCSWPAYVRHQLPGTQRMPCAQVNDPEYLEQHYVLIHCFSRNLRTHPPEVTRTFCLWVWTAGRLRRVA